MDQSQELTAPEKRPQGRPSSYSQELADRVCEEIANGASLRTVCKADDMPCVATVFSWMRTKEGFLNQYARATEERSESFVEEMTDISDDGTNDWMEKLGTDGTPIGWQINGEHVNRSRLRIETRKWIAAKMKPKKYGEPKQPLIDAAAAGAIAGAATAAIISRVESKLLSLRKPDEHNIVNVETKTKLIE